MDVLELLAHDRELIIESAESAHACPPSITAPPAGRRFTGGWSGSSTS